MAGRNILTMFDVQGDSQSTEHYVPPWLTLECTQRQRSEYCGGKRKLRSIL